MKIKVCGMREAQNIQELSELAIDYMGFIFFERSKRHVAVFPEIALPSHIKKVGVVVNESVDFLVDLIQKHELNGIQLHGGESAEFCKELRQSVNSYRSLSGVETTGRTKKVISTPLNHQIEVIKAFSVDEHFDFSVTKDYESVCDLFIFDTKGKNYGGNGVKYDWSILQKYTGEAPFLLSGGITDKDVEIVKDFHHEKCVGVDLNSGFEDAPALKNIEKLKRFIKEVK